MVVVRRKPLNIKVGNGRVISIANGIYNSQCGCGNKFKCSKSFFYKSRRGDTIFRCRDCINKSTYGDLVGERFGSLVVLKQVKTKRSSCIGARVWLAKCDCGNEQEVLGGDLKCKRKVMCDKCTGVKPHFKLRRINKFLFSKKVSICQACNYKKHSSYDKFGKIGIKICDEWRIFKEFSKWAKVAGLVKGKHVYLKKGKKVFSPENCFVRDMNEFTPYLDPTYLPDMNKPKFVKAISKPIEDIIVDHPYKKMGFFSWIKSWFFGGGEKVA